MEKTKYIATIGRRKRAVARIRLFLKKGETLVNDKPIGEYFPGKVAASLYFEPLRICNVFDKYHATIKVVGSGKSGQLGAVIHGLARALVKADEKKFHSLMKKRGFLTRDPRKRERRKAGTGGKARRKKQSPKR